MIVGAAPQRPVKFALGFADREVVNAGKTASHEAIRVEFPVLVSIRTKPVPAVVMPFVREADGYSILVESPQFLDEPIL